MMNKKEIKESEEKLIGLTNSFCTQKLNFEYKRLCMNLVKRLGRKRDVPFQRGRIEIWAAAVIYTIGSINFLFDKSFKPFVKPDDICEYFDTKRSTVTNKVREIKDMLDIGFFDQDFTTSRLAGENPFNKFVMVDGIIMLLSDLSLNLQKMVKEARARGEDIEFFTT
ncbi:MAG: DUF6398 domain-containing protein [Bacteroidia bacterium]|nr:DUF6398 domain-containing protein [Bacteroidia bacterium]